MAYKLSYDPVTKIIKAVDAPVDGYASLDAQKDFYSEGKVQWLNDLTLNKFTFPYIAVGGYDLGGGLKQGTDYFLRNDLGWRFEPYSENHELIITGNLRGFDPTLPIVSYPTGYTIAIEWERSSLTQVITTQAVGDVLIDCEGGYVGMPANNKMKIIR